MLHMVQSGAAATRWGGGIWTAGGSGKRGRGGAQRLTRAARGAGVTSAWLPCWARGGGTWKDGPGKDGGNLRDGRGTGSRTADGWATPRSWGAAFP